MEEGPEPQELMEQVEQSHHASEHSAEEEARSRFTTRCAILASALAVLAALSSLMSGHAANEAILKQSHATDQWSYYQAKSTKSHIYEGNKMLLDTLSKADSGISQSAVATTLQKFDTQSKKEQVEKEEIRQKAEDLERESGLDFAKHQNMSYGVACFQIGIVLASIAIMVRGRALFFGSIGCGVIGVIFTILGILK